MAESQTPENVWLVRGGGSGEYEDESVQRSVLLLGFQEVPDLDDAGSLDDVKERLRAALPDRKPGFYTNVGRQMFWFRHTMKSGDLVAMPLKTQTGQVRLARVLGGYEFKVLEEGSSEKRHFRSVEWLTPMVAKNLLGNDLQKSLNVPPTVSPVKAQDAAMRLLQVLAGGDDPGIASGAVEAGDLLELPIAEDPHERIKDYIAAHFRDHRFAELIEAILQADGYTTKLSPPGADEGIDVFAARGELGLESPHICVQVKMTSGTIGAPDVRGLQGSVRTYHADQGLFVSWSGFTEPARREARQAHFKLRLWAAEEVVQALYRTYELLPHEFRTRLPLRQVWTLVADED